MHESRHRVVGERGVIGGNRHFALNESGGYAVCMCVLHGSDHRLPSHRSGQRHCWSILHCPHHSRSLARCCDRINRIATGKPEPDSRIMTKLSLLLPFTTQPVE